MTTVKRRSSTEILNRGHADIAAVITPSDSIDIGPYNSVYVGGTGDLVLRGLDGATALFKAIPVGTIIYMEFDRIYDTGTDATLLTAMGKKFA